jgi:DNA invertase Pin-like site-specific DNA recombinase
MDCKFVAYLRVSTQRQADSGLGLEGQREAIDTFIKRSGCKLLRTYTECETGKRDSLDNRPELRKALSHAKRSNAILVIAKLDRLSRSVYVTSLLHREGVDFVCCDYPGANKMTIQFLTVVAENETRMVSERTRAALAAYKKRGGVLGAHNPACRDNLKPTAARKGRRLGAQASRAKALAAYEDLVPWMAELRQAGKTLQAIADELTAEGHTTRRGLAWNPMQVSRVLAQGE